MKWISHGETYIMSNSGNEEACRRERKEGNLSVKAMAADISGEILKEVYQ